jgi:hypothetical protein
MPVEPIRMRGARRLRAPDENRPFSRPARSCGARAEVEVFVMGRLCAHVHGYNLQAATRLAANDRAGLGRMAPYLA